MSGTADYDFTGRTVLVTGGATGIGAGIAGMFAERGAQVVIAQRRQEVMDAFADRYPGKVSTIRMDVREETERKGAIDFAVAQTGRLDVVVNNAISYIWGKFEDQPLDDMLAMYDTLLVGPTRMIHHAVPALRTTGGCVINVTSVIGRAVPEAPLVNPVYAAAKAGLNHLTRSLAAALAPDGIRVNAVAPGATLPEKYTDPDFNRLIIGATPMGRIGTAEDIAKVALFLASDAAGWVTGQILDAAGGWQLSS